MIFRDDDISVLTDVPEFTRVDAIFKKYGVEHTIAVIVKDIELNIPLVRYIKKNPHIVVQLHCWEHIKFTENHDLLAKHIELSLERLKYVFGITPTILYPPWNESDKEVEKIAAKFGLTVSNKKTTLTQFLKFKGKITEFDTLNFHYWHDEDAMLIEPALRIYSENLNI